MGQKKALMLFHGIPMIQRVANRVAAAASEINIIANEEEDYHFLKLPIFPDRIPGKGILGGIYTALLESENPFVAPVGCDQPFVSSKLLLAELKLIQESDADVVIPESAKGLEPLYAIYRKNTCLPEIKKALLRGDKRIISWFDEVNVRILVSADVVRIDRDPYIFLNINSVEDFNKALEIAGEDWQS